MRARAAISAVELKHTAKEGMGINLEPGRRLFAPCKCSGSIRFVHSDCLTEWLAISKKDVCELCGYKFSFQPVYADGCPRTLPTRELLLSVVIVALKKWLPLVVRGVLVIVAWGVVAPWCTSWLYRLWLLRAATMGSVNLHDRLQDNDLILADVFSGIVLIVVIVCSFLSLMSFADFLRFNMDHIVDDGIDAADDELRHRELLVAQEMEAVERAIPHPGPHMRGGGDNNIRRLIERIDGVDEWVVENEGDSDSDDDSDDDNDEDALDHQFARRVQAFRGRQPAAPPVEPDQPPRDVLPRRLRVRVQDNLPLFDQVIQHIPHAAVFRPQVARNVRPDPRVAEADNGPRRRRRRPMPANAAPPRGNNANNNDNWDDDMDHMEINIAMDEVIGFRGPPYILLRNVSWFLAFNGAYLGIFAFVPYTLGSTIVATVAKCVHHIVGDPLSMLTLDLHAAGPIDGWTAFIATVANSTREAQVNGDCLQFVDVVTCGVGYISFCVSVVAWRATVRTISLYTPHRPLLVGLLWFLSCLNAVIKVGSLLLLKTIVLPVLLGLGMDAATLPLFRASPWDRMSFFLDHMLTSMMVHWVLGISFMLFVTVVVLQMREVMHPDILAATIRPQEPNQDILKSLLAEPSVKHARRMVLSLAIYAMLLATMVYLPVRVAYAVVPSVFPLHLTFHYYFAPLQVPLELAVTYMTVLNVLDTYKHELGHVQSTWMTRLCHRLGLVEYLLPRVPALPGGGGPPDSCLILGVPPLSFNPLNDPPPPHERLYGARYVPWPEDGLVDPTVVEYNLLPRSMPTHLSLRLGVLMACCWTTTVCFVGVATLSPLYLGRLSMAMVEQYTGVRHDSVNAAAGVVASWVLINGFKLCQVMTIQEKDVHPQLIAQGFSMRKLTAAALVKLGVTWGVVFPVLIGLMAALLLHHQTPTWSKLVEMHAFGFVVLHVGDAPVVVDIVDELRQGDPTVVNSLRLGYEQLRFHLQSNDEGVEHAHDLRHRCFDPTHFHEYVIVPLGSAMAVCIVLPWMCSKAHGMLGWSSLSETHVFRAAFATQVLGLALISSKAYVSTWVTALHDSIRDERYLIGKVLQDMTR
ncbi:hypothetical protein DYB28_001659 [Aphanomyces astaci]|uniref:RING-type E3 ubiquitin transferase n=1 Tax=Aphanomyces astaci TaxID=112090 RepID=A0A9X8HCF5_APHAT|nr:hypothetical protein DYB28_001659 [Aphanomyces astaci]